jgi:hypothetical protein
MAQSPDRLRKVKVFGNVVPCPAEQAAENRPSLMDFSVFRVFWRAFAAC